MAVNNKDNLSETESSEGTDEGAKDTHRCPLCGKNLRVKIDLEEIKRTSNDNGYPFPHLHLHGSPLHAMLCYVDKQGNVRTSGFVRSIAISRNSDTFQQLTKKFSNASRPIEDW